MNHLRFGIAFAIVFSVIVFASCGADNLVAPAAEQNQDIQQCQSFDELMPNFVKALETGRTENLKTLVETQLTTSDREGVPPPINEVLRAVFRTLSRFAMQPPEPGALSGEFCAPTSAPPPLTQANALCEIRRSLDTLVHQGKGLDAIGLIEPRLQVIINYITGTGTDCKGRPRKSHYEVANVVSTFCAQDFNCQLTSGLDSVIAITDYVNTAEGKLLVQHLNVLLERPSLAGTLNTSALREEDVVTIVKLLIPAISNADGAQLRNAFDQLPLPAELKNDLKPLVDDLVVLVGHAEITTPLRQALNCYTNKDRNYDMVRMLYRITLEEECAPFSLAELTAAVKQLQEVDKRGSLIFIAGTLARAVREDELAIDSAANVCRTIMTTQKTAGQTRSNAELALPVAGELVQNGVVNEGICAIDTLLFGCAGDSQPACR